MEQCEASRQKHCCKLTVSKELPRKHREAIATDVSIKNSFAHLPRLVVTYTRRRIPSMSTQHDLSDRSYGQGGTAETSLKQSILLLLSRGMSNPTKQPQLLSVIDATQARRDRSQPIYVNEHQLFLTFIKIMFRYLAKAKVPQVEMRAKWVVSKYIRVIELLQQEQKNGDILPLWEVLRSDLRHSVGEVHWLRANDYLRLLCAKNNILVIKK